MNRKLKMLELKTRLDGLEKSHPQLKDALTKVKQKITDEEKINYMAIRYETAKRNCNSFSNRFSRTGNPQDQERYYYYADVAQFYLNELTKLRGTTKWH